MKRIGLLLKDCVTRVGHNDVLDVCQVLQDVKGIVAESIVSVAVYH